MNKKSGGVFKILPNLSRLAKMCRCRSQNIKIFIQIRTKDCCHCTKFFKFVANTHATHIKNSNKNLKSVIKPTPQKHPPKTIENSFYRI
jgi:hypothetical protein